MKIRIITYCVTLLLSGNALGGWFGIGDKEVQDYRKEAKDSQLKEIINAPDLCDVISSEACRLIIKIPDYDLSGVDFGKDDVLLLSEVLGVTPDKIEDGKETAINDARKALLRESGLTFGLQVGSAVESGRFNQLWIDYADMYDRIIDFTGLLVENPSGRNIIPPVIHSMNNSSRVSAGGRVFRFADVVYRIEEQPKFAVEPPNWRSYLKLDISKPELPVTGMLPETTQEIEYWRVFVVRGYAKGIDIVRQRVSAKYRKLVSDYTGMVTYHLLLSYNMITPPKIDYTYAPVMATQDGTVMAIDDTIAVLSVEPVFNSSRRSWELYPQLRKLKQVESEYMRTFGRVSM